MLSGFLYKRRAFKDEFVRSTRAIMMPYIIFNIVVGAIYCLVFNENILGIIKFIVLSKQESLPFAFRAMWFLTSLYTMRVIGSITGKWSLLVSIFAFLACCLYKRSNNMDFIINDPFQITSTMLCYVFFELGRVLREFNIITRATALLQKKLSIKAPLLITIYGVVFALITSVVLFLHMREVNLFRSFYGDDVFFFLFSTLLVSCFYIHTFSMVFHYNNKLIQDLADGMIFLLCTHQLVIVICNMYYKFNNIASIMFALSFILLSIFPIRLLRRYIPIALGK